MSASNKESEFFSSSSYANKKTLQLLLFVDNRHGSQKNIEQIKSYLNTLSKDYYFDLQVLEISQYPQLVEHFKLVATPALVKVNPPPQQTLAGTDLTAKLQKYWYKWQTTLKENKDIFQDSPDEDIQFKTCLPSSELIRLRDEIFRLKQEVEQLKQTIEFKEQMLAMLAHDLRSPLTAASIAVETIELAHNKGESLHKEELYQKLFKHAKKQLATMNKMVNDLLKVSKGTNYQLNVVPVKINLITLCEDIINNLPLKLREQERLIIQDIPQDLPFVYADPQLIRQVIINLLENAIKYSSASTPITLSIIHKTTQKVQVSIIDQGSGIPDEQKKRIFEGHFRLQRDSNADGYGIGLALCQEIINAHYGQIWVDDNGNQGSCFRFTLPVYR
jgi:two-component system clock-associated histidine kinase SasA